MATGVKNRPNADADNGNKPADRIQDHYNDEFAKMVEPARYSKTATPGELSQGEQVGGTQNSGSDTASSEAGSGRASGGAGRGSESGAKADGKKSGGQEQGGSELPNMANVSPIGVMQGFLGKVSGSRKGKSVIAGFTSLIVIIASAIIFGIPALGPLQFLHFAQNMQIAHFTDQSELSKTRIGRLIRNIGYKHDATKTRIGFIANNHADKVALEMKKSGFTIKQDPTTGLFKGIELDPKEATQGPFKDAKNMTDDQIKQLLADQLQVDKSKVQSKGGKYTIANDGMKRISNGRLIGRAYGVSIDKGRAWTAYSLRILIKKVGLTFNPLTKLKETVKQGAVDKYREAKENRKQRLTGDDTKNVDTKAGADEDDKGNSSDPDKAAADGGNALAEEAKAGKLNEAKFKAQKGSDIFGLLCMAKGIADGASAANKAQSYLVMMKAAAEVISVASKIQDGKDVDIGLLGAVYATSLYSHKNGSWSDARSIRNAVNGTTTGKTLPPALDPADSSNKLSIITAAIPGLSQACKVINNTFVSIGLALLGGPVDLLVLGFFQTPLGESTISWVIGQFTRDMVDLSDPKYAGPVYGEAANVGGRLDANEKASPMGGKELTDAEEEKSDEQNAYLENLDFQAQPLRDKLLNPYLATSVTGQLIDSVNPTSPGATLQNLGSMVAKAPTNLLAGFFPKVAADTATPKKTMTKRQVFYDIPKIGFTSDEDDKIDNPELNADQVADLLNGPDGDDYVERLQKCNNVTAVLDGPHGLDFTPGTGAIDYDGLDDDCKSDSDINFVKVRMAAYDTINAKAWSCIEFDDADDCGDIAPATATLSGAGDKIIAQFNTVNSDIHMDDIHRLISCGSHDDCVDKLSGYQAKAILGQGGTPPFDLVSTEETSPDQYRKLRSLLPGYDGIPSSPGEIDKMKQCDQGATAMFWNTTVFQKVAEGKTPMMNNVPRLCPKNIQAPWVELQDGSGNKYFVLTIHFPNGTFFIRSIGNKETLRRGTELIKDFVHAHINEGIVIVNGDFNDHPEEKNTYCWMTDKDFMGADAVMQNAFDFAGGKDAGTPCPSGNSPPAGFRGRSDNMYISPKPDLVGSGWHRASSSNEIMKHVSDFHIPIYYKMGVGTDSSGDTAAAGTWTWPVSAADYKPLSQCFEKPGHTGIDIPEPVGTDVHAARAGTVVKIDPSGGSDGGKYIIIKHSDTVFTNYQHNSQILVTEGQNVKAGQVIAKSGNTGFTTGPHVHFSVTNKQGLDSRGVVAYSMDPLKYLPVVAGRNLGGCK